MIASLAVRPDYHGRSLCNGAAKVSGVNYEVFWLVFTPGLQMFHKTISKYQNIGVSGMISWMKGSKYICVLVFWWLYTSV